MVALGLEVDTQVLQAHVDELRRGSMLDESGGTTTSLRDHMDTFPQPFSIVEHAKQGRKPRTQVPRQAPIQTGTQK